MIHLCLLYLKKHRIDTKFLIIFRLDQIQVKISKKEKPNLLNFIENLMTKNKIEENSWDAIQPLLLNEKDTNSCDIDQMRLDFETNLLKNIWELEAPNADFRRDLFWQQFSQRLEVFDSADRDVVYDGYNISVKSSELKQILECSSSINLKDIEMPLDPQTDHLLRETIE